jgi:hypothetical protein
VISKNKARSHENKMKTRCQARAHLKHVEVCNNVKSCKMTTTSAFKHAKIVHDEGQQSGACFKP